ncbi:hypothetical protein [Halovenus marina]|uniref:hypothetical protein n=1 Tax=Halovenus marina TaxID=3396621 RepID=UPI003F55C3EF
MSRPDRPVLFNADPNTFFYPEIVDRFQPDSDQYSATTIHRYVETLADADVDVLLVNPNTQVAWYPSAAVPTALDEYTRGDEELLRDAFTPPDTERSGGDNPNYESVFDVEGQRRLFDAYATLSEQGVDWLDETIQACREHGIEPWVSVRMNDMHGAHDPYIDFLTAPVFDDPANRLSGETMFADAGIDQHQRALDYGSAAVRDYMFAMIEELVGEYDFEGLELDWLRNPHCCEPPASDEDRSMMTEWVADVRELMDAQDGQYPLGLRVPANVPMAREIGLDLPAMSDQGLLDFVAPSNFWQTTWSLPYDRVREYVGEGVAVYGVIENAPNFVPGYDPEIDTQGVRFLGVSPELLCGNAAGKLAAGVDGIELFNFFCTDVIGARSDHPEMRCTYDALEPLGDLAALSGRPKQYALSTWVPIGQRVYEGEGDIDHTTPFNLPEQLPAVIEPGMRREFRLTMADEPDTRVLDVQVVLDASEGLVDADETGDTNQSPVGISFNGSWPRFDGVETDELLAPTGPYTEHVASSRAYEFTLDAGRIRSGWNDLTVCHGHSGTETRDERSERSVRIVSIEMAVR